MDHLVADLKHIDRVGYNAVNDKGIHAKAANRINALEAENYQLRQAIAGVALSKTLSSCHNIAHNAMSEDAEE